MPAALLDTALSFLGLRTIPDRGVATKASETRLTSANDARRLLRSCLQEDAPRALERALVKGCVDGNPPYDDERRRAEGRGWEANLNFGKGKGVMKRTGAPYFNLFARVQCLVECNTSWLPDHPDHEKWNAAIASRLDKLLRRWDEFAWAVQQISYWMRLHGIGFAFFDKDHDWRFRPVETGNVLVPKKTPSFLGERTPYVFIRVPYRVHELWERIRDEESAIAAGWNIEATRNAIKFGMKGMVGNQQSSDWYSRPWEEYQRILTSNDLTASYTDGDVINCAVMLLREYSGKISKFIFTESEIAGQEVLQKNPELAPANGQFLFTDPNCYDKYLDTLVPFFRNNGDNDGEWHGVRGYAQESFKHVESENRLLCQGLNRAFLNSSLVVSFPNERARSQAQIQVRGTIVTLPANSEPKQFFTQGGIEDLMLMQRLLGNHLDGNIGIGTTRGMSREDGRGETKTAREIDYTSSNEGSIGEAEITSYYGQKDAVYTVVFNRLVDPSNSDPESKRFQKECLEDGVPMEALQNMDYVRASRQNGYGSPEMAQMKFGQSKDLVPMMPEDGKMAWLRNNITSIHGPQAAKEFVPASHIPDAQDWQASVENEMFRNGVTPPVTAGQNDVIHLQSHIADAKQFLAPFADAADPNSQPSTLNPQQLQAPLTYVQAAGTNIQQHLARLQQDPTRRKEAQLFNDEFNNLVSFSGKLFVAYRRAQRLQKIEAEQTQSATALTALDQAKVESVRTGTALAAQKTQSSIENSRVKTVQGMALKEAKSAQDLRLAARKHAIEVPAEIVR